MEDFEKLGVFYLGKEYDIDNRKTDENLILYKSKNLTTHAVIIGMTGSGKTGLGISILEEAAIDNIPVIAIDPKGDLGNMALTFPNLKGEDFRPWVNVHDAENKGLSPDEFAKNQADLWRNGLADWGQDGERIEKLRNSSDVTVYTPGGSAGPGVSILKTFSAPSQEVKNDKDAYRDRIDITTTSLLYLIGSSGDPFTSREYILLSNIFKFFWDAGESLGLPELISAIQKPPMDKVGVMDLESFYPSKDRFTLAMMFNNLLASPSFKVWMEGAPLDINKFLYNDSGKPRTSIFSIAHLPDNERMFFVTMLLNEILSWVRTQPGTGSLRAILYMDEIFGYLPPVANPPSKAPFLTLLKQARAYGLGLVVATQNPVDLDYKALSNTGTWFIGRLQTERDKERVLSGLEGVSAGEKFDRRKTEQILAGLGQRIFYLHSVHEDEPLIFNTRWTMSYLAGPLTRDQIAALPSSQEISKITTETSNDSTINLNNNFKDEPTQRETENEIYRSSPILAPQIKQVYLPAEGPRRDNLVYMPSVIGVADVLFNNAKHNVTVSKSYTLIAPVHEGPVALDWSEAEFIELDLRNLETKPLDGASYTKYPEAVVNAKNYDNWNKLLTQFIRTDVTLKLFYNSRLKLVSEVGEDERDFRIRLQHLAHEHRDEALEALKKKYASKITTLENKQRLAQQAIEKQNTMAKQKKMDAAVSTGTAILGALFGRKATSATSISKMGTAMKSGSRVLTSGQGIEQAQERLQTVNSQIEELQLELQEEIGKISDSYNLLDEKLDEVEIRATSSNINVRLVGLAWTPQ